MRSNYLDDIRIPPIGFIVVLSNKNCQVPDSGGITKQGFIRTATLIGMRTRAGSVRINPVGLNRVAAPLQRYGDCKTARA
jgi:hypothetical protein